MNAVVKTTEVPSGVVESINHSFKVPEISCVQYASTSGLIAVGPVRTVGYGRKVTVVILGVAQSNPVLVVGVIQRIWGEITN